MLLPRLLASLLVCACAAPAVAQEGQAAPGTAEGTLFPNISRSSQWRLERISADHLRLTGEVEIEGANEVKFFADQVDLYTDTNRLVASGNVVFTDADGRIAADEVDFDTVTGTGIFRQASGIMSLGATASQAQFASEEPDVYFYGETIEKIGPRSYRVTRGAFTTCVQPTPRWEVTSGSVTLKLDDYAVATNTVLRVKGVPLLYLPIIYYPIQDDQRATGFLLPTYGASTLRGQAVSNAFFWAIGRSHDATFLHDWFTRAGQGVGGEYRYVAGPQSTGNVRLYRFSQRQTEFTQDGQLTVLPENTAYEVTGVVNHAIGRSMRARARLDYFSDVVNQQLYHQNVYEASRRSRIVEGALSGNFGGLSTSLLYQRSEVFNDETNSVLYGSTPRISASLAPRRIGASQVYASVNSEYAYLPYRFTSGTEITRDSSLGRFDVSPTIRMPLSSLTYLSVNSSATFRSTYYSKSADLDGMAISEPFRRQYLGLRTEVIGPVLSRIFDRPDGRFAERLKHVIEPGFTFDYTTAFEDYLRTPLLSDTSDIVVGGAGRITYGLTNRLFARSRAEGTQQGQIREFLTVALQQSYYTNPESSQYDTTYASAFRGRNLTTLSPVALTVRMSPSAAVDANARMEYDVSGQGLQVFTTGGSVRQGRTTSTLNFSRRRYSGSTDSYLSSTTALNLMDGRMTGTYSLSWDISRSTVVSQTVSAAYLAQCCGIQMQFQNYNFPRLSSSFPIPADRRFNVSFVLAGLGTFSNFFGAFGGAR